MSAITPSGDPYWAGTNTHATYGGNTDKANWRDQPATNSRTDVDAAEFVRMTENVAACGRVLPFCKFLLNVTSQTPPHNIDWIRYGACRVGFRQSLVIRDNLSGLAHPPPVPDRNYLLHSDTPFNGASPPDEDPLAVTESNGFPKVGTTSGGFTFKFALDYCDQFGSVKATNIRAIHAAAQTTSLRVVSSQITSSRDFLVRVADISGVAQFHPLLIEVFTSDS
jgi:hypothetical protein